MYGVHQHLKTQSAKILHLLVNQHEMTDELYSRFSGFEQFILQYCGMVPQCLFCAQLPQS